MSPTPWGEINKSCHLENKTAMRESNSEEEGGLLYRGSARKSLPGDKVELMRSDYITGHEEFWIRTFQKETIDENILV